MHWTKITPVKCFNLRECLYNCYVVCRGFHILLIRNGEGFHLSIFLVLYIVFSMTTLPERTEHVCSTWCRISIYYNALSFELGWIIWDFCCEVIIREGRFFLISIELSTVFYMATSKSRRLMLPVEFSRVQSTNVIVTDSNSTLIC